MVSKWRGSNAIELRVGIKTPMGSINLKVGLFRRLRAFHQWKNQDFLSGAQQPVETQGKHFELTLKFDGEESGSDKRHPINAA